jgi:hypothetical protein
MWLQPCMKYAWRGGALEDDAPTPRRLRCLASTRQTRSSIASLPLCTVAPRSLACLIHVLSCAGPSTEELHAARWRHSSRDALKPPARRKSPEDMENARAFLRRSHRHSGHVQVQAQVQVQDAPSSASVANSSSSVRAVPL